MQRPDTIHVIDDDEGVRDGLCALLEAKRFHAVAHESCEAFLNAFDPDRTLCIVADLRLPGMGGLDLQSQLLLRNVDLPFIVITGHGDVSSAVRALKSGALDFIEKPIDGNLFCAVIEKAAGQRQAAFEQKLELSGTIKRLAMLSPRERDVLRHLVVGHPNKIIAHELDISQRTVENHRARLMVKMQVDSVAELVRLALVAGIDGKEASTG